MTTNRLQQVWQDANPMNMLSRDFHELSPKDQQTYLKQLEKLPHDLMRLAIDAQSLQGLTSLKEAVKSTYGITRSNAYIPGPGQEILGHIVDTENQRIQMSNRSKMDLAKTYVTNHPDVARLFFKSNKVERLQLIVTNNSIIMKARGDQQNEEIKISRDTYAFFMLAQNQLAEQNRVKLRTALKEDNKNPEIKLADARNSAILAQHYDELPPSRTSKKRQDFIFEYLALPIEKRQSVLDKQNTKDLNTLRDSLTRTRFSTETEKKDAIKMIDAAIKQKTPQRSVEASPQPETPRTRMKF